MKKECLDNHKGPFIWWGGGGVWKMCQSGHQNLFDPPQNCLTLFDHPLSSAETFLTAPPPLYRPILTYNVVT